MKSKTKIGKQVSNKRNLELVETVLLAKKHPAWMAVAGALSGPRKNLLNINLGELNEKVKEGESVVVPGKVLSQGELTKKSRIVALNFSGPAKEKLLKEKKELTYIIDEIKKNPSAKGVRILTQKDKEKKNEDN